MKQKEPALPDLLSLPDLERKIYAHILVNWPTTPLELAENFNEKVSTREEKKRASTKYSYYLKKLLQKRLIVSKKAGNSVIVWPLVVEKYRAIHDILKHHEAEHLALLKSSSNEVQLDA
jgi:predicted transcriptional regulator